MRDIVSDAVLRDRAYQQGRDLTAKGIAVHPADWEPAFQSAYLHGAAEGRRLRDTLSQLSPTEQG